MTSERDELDRLYSRKAAQERRLWGNREGPTKTDRQELISLSQDIDAWLAAHDARVRREAKVEALREAAEGAWSPEDRTWLERRANLLAIERGETDE